MLTTTLSLLKKHNACVEGYRKLKKALGKIENEDPIPLAKIAETNGLDDALWALRAVPEDQMEARDRAARIFACRCIRETPLADGRKVWDLLTDGRSKEAVETAEKFLCGEASGEKLAAAWAAAGDAARDAAGDAAWAAARDAAGDAAWAAAWDAAWAAAGDAARDAAGAAAGDAARDAAGAAAGDAARDAAGAAAGAAAWAAAWAAQKSIFCEEALK